MITCFIEFDPHICLAIHEGSAPLVVSDSLKHVPECRIAAHSHFQTQLQSIRAAGDDGPNVVKNKNEINEE